jgi:hypothetical protein
MRRLTERLYLTADKKRVVKHGDPDAATLLGVKGTLISDADAKRLGVKGDAADDMTLAPGVPLRSQLVVLPVDDEDDSLYDDQTERGIQARKDAREMNTAGIMDYVLSTGGSDEDAEQAAAEAQGNQAPQGPTVEDQQKANAALVGETPKKK